MRVVWDLLHRNSRICGSGSNASRSRRLLGSEAALMLPVARFLLTVVIGTSSKPLARGLYTHFRPILASSYNIRYTH